MNRIDTARFCQESAMLAGQLTSHDLPRLSAELMPESSFSVVWSAQAEPPDQMTLSLQSIVQLRCQRCLNELDEVIDVRYVFRFVKDETTALAQDEASDEFDHLAHSQQFDLLTLIEDEMLMALPLVSMHPVCPQISWANLPLNQTKPNPFEVLNTMKLGK